LSSRYVGKGKFVGRTVHNTFLNVATEWGIQGFIFYLGFLIHSFFIMMRIKKYAHLTQTPNFYYLNASALQLGLVGNLIAGMTHNHQYMEIIFWLCAFSVVLRVIQKKEIYEIESNKIDDVEVLKTTVQV